ncbi:MAG: DUF2339 domain-containing protein [Deltaproteobacteria bacterium]|nr:DUF2339 domain-containing protein [Deltaproteobacteria bacterium]
MPILVTIIAWIVAGAFTSGEPISLVIAVMCGVIYSQGRRLKALEVKLGLRAGAASQKSAPGPAEAAPPQTVPATAQADTVAASPATKVPDQTVLPPPAEIPLRAADKKAASSAPRSTSEAIERLFGPTIAGFILRGNPIARIGVVILFFGVVFALKFASDEGFIPIEVRLFGAALGAFVLMGIGWKLRERRPQFSVTLQGAGAGVFYITAFIAFRLYHLIPAPFAFALLLGITILSALLAVLQNARSLAVVAMIGGFLAPALTSEGGGSHILLFSYLALLNLGIFGICWFKSWRELNLTGFFFSFVMASLWGQRYYRPEFLVSSEFFLIFFLLLYSAITVLFAARSTATKPGTIDTLMTFGTPVWAFWLQYGLVKDIEYGLAWSAAGFGAFYVLLAQGVFRSIGVKAKLLTQSFLFVGLCFLSLAVPFAFSGRLTSAIWAVEGVALIWSGIKQKHWLTRFAGQLLIVLSSFFFLNDLRFSNGEMAFFNSFFEGVALLSLSSLFAARLLTKADADTIGEGERRFAWFFSAIGLLWWFCGGYVEVWCHLADWHDVLWRSFPQLAWGWIPWGLNVYSVFASLSVLLFWALARYCSIHEFKFLRELFMPVHAAALAVYYFEASWSVAQYRVHPFMSLGFISWTLAFVVHYGMLRVEDSAGQRKSPGLHQWGLLVLITVLAWESFSLIGRLGVGSPSWALTMWLLVPAFCMLFISAQVRSALRQPFVAYAEAYLKALRFVAVWLLFCMLSLDVSQPGSADPLPYIPLLNPLDIGQAVAFLALIRWWMLSKQLGIKHFLGTSAAIRIPALCAFLWATILLLRCYYHYSDVPWNIELMLETTKVQAALSIFWSSLALILMVSAHLKGWRPVWKAGACLIAVVVAKLFLVDLSNQGTISRIAAFLGVGLLMLCIGYFAPIPPQESSSKE